MKCGICDASYRKGTTVLVSRGGADFKRTRVCPTCAKGAVSILPIKATTCKCGKHATVCKGCARSREKRASKPALDVSALAKRLRGLAKVYTSSNVGELGAFLEGKIEAFNSAAELVESGKWGQ